MIVNRFIYKQGAWNASLVHINAAKGVMAKDMELYTDRKKQ